MFCVRKCGPRGYEDSGVSDSCDRIRVWVIAKPHRPGDPNYMVGMQTFAHVIIMLIRC